MKDFIIINIKDNVGVALQDLKKGSKAGDITLKEDVPHNFKFALTDIKKGNDVNKYGFPIGIASQDIENGKVIHSHNLKTKLGGIDGYNIEIQSKTDTHIKSQLTFKGYKRNNGKIGIRNDIFIIPTVGCVNSLCDKIAEKAIKFTGYQDINVFKHPYGCSQLGDDQKNTQKILAGLANHPNAGGVLIVSLGCENNNLKEFKPFIEQNERIKYLVAQDVSDELEKGFEIVTELVKVCENDKREDMNISELIIGLKCGGSDALSGVTANPLAGLITDKITQAGGSAILTEVPEMFGAEHILMQRSGSQNIYGEIIQMINNFKNYYISHGEPVGENPSPGNKEGGITTLEEKSLGCIQKGGSAKVSGVIDYGEKIKEKGLTLLSAPGNDIVAQTALAAAGAHIILFTTGRGTPIGAAVPTIKISTNTELAKKKPNWIDFDAGILLENKNPQKVAESLFQLILQTASGDKTKNEINDFRDIAIWKNGVTL